MRAAWTFCTALLPAAAGFAGTPVVFHSTADDGVDPGGPVVLSGSSAETLFLYLDAGGVPTTSGTPCVDGNGDELCAWELQLQVSGAADFGGFTPDPGRDVVFAESALQVDATGGDALAGEPGPIRLGELELSISGPEWSVDLTAGTVVDAGFARVSLPAATLALPEPGSHTSLLAGGLGLALLARRRRTTC